jgi:DNA ligase (NAD+)
MSASKTDKLKTQRLEELRAELKRHDELYYRLAQPDISDQLYDQKKRELEELEAEIDPLGLFSKSSEHSNDTQPPVVGDDRLESFSSHRHLKPMLSLDNTYDEEEFFEFDQRLRRIFETEKLSYVVEPKIDGVAISLTYKNGKLETATTRGNGVEGDIVTQNLEHLEHLPQQLIGSNLPELIEIRGEIYMSHQEFERINSEREKNELSLYANPKKPCSWNHQIARPQGSKKTKTGNCSLWPGCMHSGKPFFQSF